MNKILTNSCLACHRTCPRKYKFQYELGVRPEKTSQALRMGSNVHAGLDMLAMGIELQKVLDTVLAQYESVPAWADAHEWMTEGYTVQRLVHAYAMRYEHENFEIVETEMPFFVKIENPETGKPTPSFTLAGKIDKIVRLPDGRLAILEHKTTSDSIDENSDYWNKLRLDMQISLYLLAARQEGYEIGTIIYDVIRKPGISPKKVVKKDVLPKNDEDEKIGQFFKYYDEVFKMPAPESETPEMYAARLTDDIASRPEFYFARKEVARTSLDIQEAQNELWMQQKMIREMQLYDRWYRNTNACLHPYKCEYTSICFNNVNLAEGLPEGFVKVDDVHPELERKNATPTPESEVASDDTSEYIPYVTGLPEPGSINREAPTGKFEPV